VGDLLGGWSRQRSRSGDLLDRCIALGRVDGDPREVLLSAAKAARQFGWVITDAHCFVSGYLANGWKQFDHFVAYLSISWVDYPGEDRDRFYLKAETPPVSAGGTNQLHLPVERWTSREVV
jgi:hypothetical protein